MLLYGCYFVNIVQGIEIVTDWLTVWLIACLASWLADWLNILFWDFMVEDSEIFMVQSFSYNWRKDLGKR